MDYWYQILPDLACNGASKFNLIGHNRRANSMRYAAGEMPEHIALVMIISSANKSAKLQIRLKVSGRWYFRKIARAIFDLLVSPVH